MNKFDLNDKVELLSCALCGVVVGKTRRISTENLKDSYWVYSVQTDKYIKPVLCHELGLKLINRCCKHEWKQYIGFTNQYDYCVKCNIIVN